MDITNTEQGEWLELDCIDDKVGSFKLRLLPIPANLRAKMKDLPEDGGEAEIAVPFIPYVVGWTMTRGADEVACTDDEKAKILPHVLFLRVKPKTFEDNEDIMKQGWIMALWEVVKFATNKNNFVKN